MKLKMHDNSLFGILLRSPWWISLAIAAALVAVSFALLPEDWRIVGAVSALPFLVIGGLAIRRQWRLPSRTQVTRSSEAMSAMAWPAFAALLEAGFRRDGYTVEAGTGAPVDFAIERQGRRMLVSARRWKAARTGIEPLRALQAAREASDAPDALYVCLNGLTDTAARFASERRIQIWQAAELAQVTRGLPKAPARKP